MIIVDTGPMIALFDPADSDHLLCRQFLDTVQEPLLTTLPVLTEAFHMLTPSSQGSHRLMDFVAGNGMVVWPVTGRHLPRAFELMMKYADHPMDLADASLVLVAELEHLTRIFTLDHRDFANYRIKRGHRHVPFEVIP